MDLSNLSEDVRAKLAELDLELSEGEFSIFGSLFGEDFFFGKTNIFEMNLAMVGGWLVRVESSALCLGVCWLVTGGAAVNKIVANLDTQHFVRASNDDAHRQINIFIFLLVFCTHIHTQIL